MHSQTILLYSLTRKNKVSQIKTSAIIGLIMRQDCNEL